jgi:curli production assembly/transport component CsgF
LQDAKDAAALAKNTNLSKFLNNFESRVYAQLSTQLVNNLFGENPQNSGTVTIEGNTIQYTKTADMISMTVTASDGSITQVQIPIGQLKF